MKKIAVPVSFVFLASALAMAWLGGGNPEAERNWPQWRGPLATGVAPHGNPPLEWAEEKNIKWKVEIPGKGSSSPIVWGNRVFMTTAIPTGPEVAPKVAESPGPLGTQSSGTQGSQGPNPRGSQAPRTQGFQGPNPGGSQGPRAQGLRGPQGRRPGAGRRRRRGPRGIQPTRVHRFVLYALDRESGKVIWERTLKEELPHEGTHPTGTWASSSPITDGTHVYAFFGSRGLYCLDRDGNVIWDKDLGDMDIRFDFGEGSSPALYEDKIILSWDHEGPSFAIAFDKATGKELWRTERDEMTSWATPLVVDHGDGQQVVTSATNRVRSYDLATGKLVWETGGMTMNPIPSPVAANGMVYITSGFRGNKLLAIRLDGARGDITGTDNIVWSLDRDTPYVPSPLLYGDTLYFFKHNSGILSAFDARTGEEYYGQQRVEGISNIYSSPVGAGNRVYITSREGTTVVIQHGREYKVLATNTLDDGFDASMAVVDNEIYLRGRKSLYRISEN